MLIKVLLVDCASHGVELDGFEGEVQAYEVGVRKCEKESGQWL
jgi:hypothetical protein